MAASNVHQAKDGTKTYRVRVRRKGQPVRTDHFFSLAKRHPYMGNRDRGRDNCWETLSRQ